MNQQDVTSNEARLNRAAGIVAAQAGMSSQAFVEWLCDGGLVRMALSYYAASDAISCATCSDTGMKPFAKGLMAKECQDCEGRGGLLRRIYEAKTIGDARAIVVEALGESILAASQAERPAVEEDK